MPVTPLPPSSSALSRAAGYASSAGPALVAGASFLRDPSAITVTAHSTISPRITVRPFAPQAAQRQAPGSWSPSGLLMGLLRPSIEVGGAGSQDLLAVEPWGDPDELPLGWAVGAGLLLFTGCALYGAWRLVRG